MNLFTQPWPAYVAGPLIGLMVPALLLLVGKPFGVSSSFRHICSIAVPRSPIQYLKENDWKAELWNLLFVGGIVLGAAIASRFLMSQSVPFLPAEYSSLKGGILLFIGGLMVGFGTRYADGCTSGHSIMGLSSLNWPSLVATICFFAGGLTVTWFILPLLNVGAGS